MWFSPHPFDIAVCLRLCAGCPVRQTCLADALARGEHHGIWGGRLLSHEMTYANPVGLAAQVAA